MVDILILKLLIRILLFLKCVNGDPFDIDSCTVNYGNAVVVIGTSATLFNQFLLRKNSTKMPRYIRHLEAHILKGI